MGGGEPPGKGPVDDFGAPGTEIDAVAEEFLDRLLAGEFPDRFAIAADHPHIRHQLARRLALMEILFRSRPRL